MGNSDSEPISETDNSLKDPLIEQFEHLKGKNDNFISQATFDRTLSRSKALSKCLWTAFVSTETPGMTFKAYSALIMLLDDRRDKLTKLADLVLSTNDRGFSEEEGLEFIRIFFEVPLQNYTSSPSFIFNAFKTTTENNSEHEQGIYNQREFITWLNRNFPEMSEDVFHYMHNALTTNDSASPSVCESISNPLCILTPEIAVYLSMMLPSIYKYGFSTETSEVLTYEVEKIANWNLLFTTARDGASVSRFVDCACEYLGPAIVLLKSDVATYCIASDSGLKESYQTYGDSDSRLYQLYPTFTKLVSGSARSTTSSSQNGIIYCHFNTQSGRRGITVGHQPLQRPVLEVDGDLSQVSLLGQTMKLYRVEVWAAGDPKYMSDFIVQKKWNRAQVEKNKNRKYKLDDWADSPDRQLLSWGGVNVTHSDVVEEKRS